MGVARGGIVETGVRGVGARREAPMMTATTGTTVTKATPRSLSVRHNAVLLPPRPPPSDGDGDGGGGRQGGGEGVLSRLVNVTSELGLPHHRDGNDGDDGKNEGDVVM